MSLSEKWEDHKRDIIFINEADEYSAQRNFGKYILDESNGQEDDGGEADGDGEGDGQSAPAGGVQ